jgi:hypothetical protein
LPCGGLAAFRDLFGVRVNSNSKEGVVTLKIILNKWRYKREKELMLFSKLVTANPNRIFKEG